MISRLALLLTISWMAMTASAVPVIHASLTPAVSGQRILIVAPHIDDEALGAGGYAIDAVAAGAEVFIVYLTAGDHSRTALVANRLTFFATASVNQKGTRRMAEARRAAHHLGIEQSNQILLGYPDRGLKRMLRNPDSIVRSASTGHRHVPYADALSPGAEYRASSLYADLRSVIEAIGPDVVISTVDTDHHPDHRVSATLVSTILGDAGSAAMHLGYKIHHPPLRARSQVRSGSSEQLVYVLTRETVMKKRAMLGAYASQRRSPYLRFLFSSRSRGDERFVRLDAPPAGEI